MNGTGEYQLHVLGMFRIERATEVVKLPRRKAAALLAYLALHPQEHGRNLLAALFWGDYPDEEARRSLRVALTALRNAVDEDILIANNDSVRLNPTFPLWVDAAAFETYAKRFLAEPPFDLSTSFIDLYEGDLLPDFYDDWAVAERERLRTLYLNVLLRVAEQMRSRSEYGRAIEFAQRVLASEPSNERAHQHMMFCYVAQGDRSAALKQYAACQRALQDELGVEPMAETSALYEWIKGQRTHATAREARITNLPAALSSFVGRQREMAQIKRLLAQARLLTLAGPGGSGKTRLAIQVATDLMDAYKDGVWFIDLSSVQSPALVPQAVINTLGVTGSGNRPADEAIVDFLRQRTMLLLLDNCEHVAAACTRLAEAILAGAADVRVLATSRETLNVQGEHVYHVPALSSPAVGAVPPSLAILSTFEATRLFMERAKAASPEISLADQDGAAVAAICRRLDGMPLAIELAAARVKVLSVRQIADLLRDRFTLLETSSRSLPPRQHSLRAAIDWSYDLLSAEEQVLLRRLSVFVGGFALAGAAAVNGSDEADVLDLVSQLVDKSLVVAGQAGEVMRYRLLETIRLYAWERLVDAGEKDDVVHRFVSFICHFVEDAGQRYMREQPQVEIQQVRVEYDNIIAALEWCREIGDANEGLRLVAVGLSFLAGECDLRWLDGWLQAMLSAKADVPNALRGQGLAVAGRTALWQGDLERAYTLGEDGLALCRAAGDDAAIAFAALYMGRSATFLGKHDEAASLLEESLTLYGRLGYQAMATRSLLWLAHMHSDIGDQDQARALVADALEECKRTNDLWGEHYALRILAEMAARQGDYAAAAGLVKESMAICMDGGLRIDVGLLALPLAACAAGLGEVEQAVILFGAFGSFQKSVGVASFLHSYARQFSDIQLPAIRAELGEAAFDALVARGRAMSVQEAIKYALT